MIAYIKGIVTYIQDDSIIIDVSGIGYEILCANPFVFQSSIHTEIMIYTYHHVREDAESLYGFKTVDEKQLFKKLLSVSGIGPKSALHILGAVDIESFVRAIEQEDDKFLTKFPGIGKKTARQVILDLKGKLTGLISISGDIETNDDLPNTTLDDIWNEAMAALKALGYSEKELKQVRPTLQREGMDTTDAIIRRALQLLSKG